jgi:hypothetical protein
MPTSGTVRILAVGTCTIRVSQAGNGNYNAAPNVERSFSINCVFLGFLHFMSATTETGNWTSSSDLAVLSGKSGTVVQTTMITVKGKGKAKAAKTGQVIHGLKHVTASDGTCVLQFSGGIKPTSATTSEIKGRFVLKKGTGACSRLHGTGAGSMRRSTPRRAL